MKLARIDKSNYSNTKSKPKHVNKQLNFFSLGSMEVSICTDKALPKLSVRLIKNIRAARPV